MALPWPVISDEGQDMIKNHRADMVAGMLTCCAGLAIAVYASSTYPMGTLRRMGPGMFPAGVGATLSLLGLVLAFNSWRKLRAAAGRALPPLGWEMRTALLTITGVLAFAFLLRPLGLVPAVLAVVGISALADHRNTPRIIAVLAVLLATLATIIFKLGLGMTFPLFAWNWT